MDTYKNAVRIAAHRGNSKYYPENTIIAFKSALQLPVDQLEIDLHMSKDGHIVMMHDHTVDRTTNGTGRVRDLTLAELKELDAGSWKGEQFAGTRIPTFVEFLEMLKDYPEMTVNVELKDYNLLQTIPYVLVLLGGIAGINVFVVLLIGILSGSVIMLATGAMPATELLSSMGSGAAGMFETTMVAVLVSAICALIRENRGFDALLGWIYQVFRGKKGGQLGMGLLVGAMDIATANNTVAIVMANPIAAEMAESYGISKRKTASLLDTFSCVFQGIIPYGAQMLVAISACEELGQHVSAFQIIPNLFYPFLLLVSSLLFIYVIPERKAKKRTTD